VKDAEEAIKGSDKEKIEAATQALAMASQKLGEKMYAKEQGNASGNPAGGADAGPAGAAGKDDGNVVDAEFEEVKEAKK